MGPTRVRACFGQRILADVGLCGSISRRSKPNSHAGRDETWDIQEGHRSIRIHQGYQFAHRSLWFEPLLPISHTIYRCPFLRRISPNVVPTPFLFTTNETHSSKGCFVIRHPFERAQCPRDSESQSTQFSLLWRVCWRGREETDGNSNHGDNSCSGLSSESGRV